MDQERFEVIAAFADGERVDTHALRAALSNEAGRDYLIDLVAMREIVKQTDEPRWATPTAGVVRWSRSMTGLAAALAMAVGLAGFAIGQQRSQMVPVAVHPPLEADVVVALEAPPAPTQIIRLEGSGGNGASTSGGR
jgi:hypothetical protein